MTSRERIVAAMKRQPVDQIPISPRIIPCHSYLGYQWPVSGHVGGEPITLMDIRKKYFFDPHITGDYAASLSAFVDHYPGPTTTYAQDCSMFVEVRSETNTLRSTTTVETPAGKLRQVRVQPKAGCTEFGASPNPHIAEFFIKDKSDVEKARYLIPPRSTFSLGSLPEMNRAIGEDGIVMLSVSGPMDHTGGNFVSMTDLMMAYYDDREFFDAVFKLFTDFSNAQLDFAIENGVKHFFLVYFYESLSAGWSPAIYQEVFVPIIRDQVRRIHAAGGLACMYDDGALMKSLPFIVETGVDCIETCTPAPAGDFNIVEAKRLYGNKIAFKGGVDIIDTLQGGTPELIDRKIKELVEVGAVGSGLLIGTSDSIRPETPEANFAAFFASSLKYAKQFAHLTHKSA